jgi:hypothetical protein
MGAHGCVGVVFIFGIQLFSSKKFIIIFLEFQLLYWGFVKGWD